MKTTKKIALITAVIMLASAFTALAVNAESTTLEWAQALFTPVVSTAISGSDPMLIQDGNFENCYNTYQGDDKMPCREWYGYTFDKTYTVHAVEFTDGEHFWNGGVFLYGELDVEALINGSWTKVASSASPEYPTYDSSDDWNWKWDNADPKPIGFQKYTITLNSDTACDGIRVIGQAGGRQNFTTCAELRVQAYLTSAEAQEAKEAEEILKDAEKAILRKYYKSKSGAYKSGTAIGEPDKGWTRVEAENTTLSGAASVHDNGIFSNGKGVGGFTYGDQAGIRPAGVAADFSNLDHITFTFNSANAGDTVAKLAFNGGGNRFGVIVKVNDGDPYIVNFGLYSNDGNTVCWDTIPLTLKKGENTIIISGAVQTDDEELAHTWINFDFVDVKDPAVSYSADTGSNFAAITTVSALAVISIVALVKYSKKEH